MNKKIIFIVFTIILLILVGIVLAFTIKDNNIESNGELGKNKMRITMYDSSGIRNNLFQNAPKKSIKIYDIKLNEKIQLKGLETVNFEIIKIDEGSITIKINNDMLMNGKTVNEFTVHNGEKVTINTMTVDLADSFEFEINV